MATYLRGRIARESARMRADGVPQPVINYRAAASVTPRFIIPSEVDADLMSMHLATHDNRMKLLDDADADRRLQIMRAAVGLYFDEDEAAEMTPDYVSVAATAITAVLNDIRALFVCRRDADFHERTGIPKGPRDDVGQDGGEDEGREEGGGGQDGGGQAPASRSLVREVVRPPEVDVEAAEALRSELEGEV
jgi:hypothetical protein